MIEFNKIVIKDFMSFHDASLEFHKTETILLGDNRDSCGADDNGSGKSTVAEAVRWALYGETVRAAIDKTLSVEHVLRKGAKRASVRLEVVVGGVPLVITRVRTQTTGKLVVEHGGVEHTARAAQNVIDTCLGINVVQFSNLVHLDGSYPRLFAPSTDKDRKEILADLVEVAIADKMQDEATARYNSVKHVLDSLLDNIRTAEFELQTAKDNMTRYSARDKEHFNLLLEAQGQVEKYEEFVKKAEAKKAKAEKELKDTKVAENTKVSDLQQKALDAETAEVKSRQEEEKCTQHFLIVDIQAVVDRIDSLKVTIRTNKNEINRIKELQASGQCPTCGQDTAELDATAVVSLTSQTEEIEREIEELRNSRESLETARREEYGAHKERTSKFSAEAKGYREQANELLEEGYKEREAKREKVAVIASKLDEGNRRLAKAQTAVKLHGREVKDARAERLVAKTQARLAEEALADMAIEYVNLEEEMADLDFWKKGFGPKGVPSLFIETVLPSISERIQKYADILTGGDVVVTLRAFRETKSKTTQESIQISAVNSKGASVYGANSTGERNRINMAVTLGLIEYFRDMGVFESDLLICDEIFDGLDSTGVEQGILALREAGIPKVLVISHHDHLQPLFSNAIHVRKERGVSTIIGDLK